MGVYSKAKEEGRPSSSTKGRQEEGTWWLSAQHNGCSCLSAFSWTSFLRAGTRSALLISEVPAPHVVGGWLTLLVPCGVPKHPRIILWGWGAAALATLGAAAEGSQLSPSGVITEPVLAPLLPLTSPSRPLTSSTAFLRARLSKSPTRESTSQILLPGNRTDVSQY